MGTIIGRVAAVLLVSAVALVSRVAAADPDPGTIYITDMTYNGSGCPLGSTVAHVADDATTFTVIHSQFLAQVGPGIMASEARKNCQINLGLFVPQGFSYAVASVDYRGYAGLAPGANARQKAIYYFEGHPVQGSTAHMFYGPVEDDWHVNETADVAALIWSPCGEKRNLNINAEIRLARGTSPASASSYMTMDSEDGSIETLYHLAWKKCP
ncbi:MAG: putative secreted protein [Myxococcales bacterium]|nr:putative secreted protein [Myxococcales bacterium]